MFVSMMRAGKMFQRRDSRGGSPSDAIVGQETSLCNTVNTGKSPR